LVICFSPLEIIGTRVTMHKDEQESIELFNQLSLDQKGSLAFTRGEFVGDRAIYNAFDIQLYNANGLFIEVCYNPKGNEIVDVRAVTQESVLENYFDLRDLYYNNRNVLPPTK
jgi:hypothetical protein